MRETKGIPLFDELEQIESGYRSSKMVINNIRPIGGKSLQVEDVIDEFFK